MAALVAGVWLGLLADPVVGPWLVLALAMFGSAVALVLAAVGLGWLGFGLFAMGDRVVGWLKRVSSWPES